MRSSRMNRRQLLAGLMSASVVGILPPLGHAAQAQHDSEEPPAITPDQALERLIAGNERFTSGKVSHPHQDLARRTELTKGQSPFAVIVGCSDSRVSPEVVFDQGLGDLFVVRVAGNVVDSTVAGSVEYAVAHLHSSVVLVLGHEKCGAVTAALLPQSDRQKESANIQALLNQIEPSLRDLGSHLTQDQRLVAGIEANALLSARNLGASPVLSRAVEEKKLKILSAVYQLGSGKAKLIQ
jgi:carbonic anhydrase